MLMHKIVLSMLILKILNPIPDGFNLQSWHVYIVSGFLWLKRIKFLIDRVNKK